MHKTYSKYSPYGSDLARKKQRRFFVKIGLISAGVLSFTGGLVYLFLFSKAMIITEVNINGLKTVTVDQINPIIDSLKNKKLFSFLRFGQNILFFDSNFLRSQIINSFPIVKNVEISKEFPHKITVDIEERSAVGTWCIDENCRYFDESGILWGTAVRSSGSLLLNVADLTASNSYNKIDSTTLKPILDSVQELNALNFKIENIEIMPGGIGDFKIYITNSYYILLNTESDISGQIKALKLLIGNNPPDFKPNYIDLRIDGRIYYK